MPRSLSLLALDANSERRFRSRVVLFSAWLALIGWLCSTHIFFRDEVRAFSLALSGSSVADMLRNVHGEGHPALWYLILRAGLSVFPYREILPVTAAIVAAGAMAILAFRSPFRTAIVALVLFSFYGAFEYAVMARNYGISMLVMFTIAALYPRAKTKLWLGLLIAILCNTNVASCLLAAGFLLFRLVEMFTDTVRPTRRDLLAFIGNCLLAAVGAYLCFRTVYPTFNDAAVSPRLQQLNLPGVFAALADPKWSFSHLTYGGSQWPLDTILLMISCFGLVRKPAAFIAAIMPLLALKLFFYFVYISYYRHEILYLIFLLSLFWMVAEGAGGTWRQSRFGEPAQTIGAAVMIALLGFQTGRLIAPIEAQFAKAPLSQSAAAGRLLQRPEFRRAIVMGDPDTMLEPIAYYADNPIWFLRQQRFGKVVRLSTDARHELSFTDILDDAQRLHRTTGRPILILSHLKLQMEHETKSPVMFKDATVMRQQEVTQFLAATRLVAKLRPALSDEEYDAYIYPR